MLYLVTVKLIHSISTHRDLYIVLYLTVHQLCEAHAVVLLLCAAKTRSFPGSFWHHVTKGVFPMIGTLSRDCLRRYRVMLEEREREVKKREGRLTISEMLG